MTNPHIEQLNRRLGDSLGRVCGGSLPRFAWLHAPDQPWMVYDRDDRTLLRKSWADAPGPDGQPIGRTWLLAGWAPTTAQDHHGYGSGVRIAVTHDAGYKPYYETAVARGQQPSEALNQNYVWALARQLAASAEHDEDSVDNHMAEEKYTADRNSARERTANRERSMHVYDDNVGAFGNCEVGVGDGFMSWGGIKDTPLAVSSTPATAPTTP